MTRILALTLVGIVAATSGATAQTPEGPPSRFEADFTGGLEGRFTGSAVIEVVEHAGMSAAVAWLESEHGLRIAIVLPEYLGVGTYSIGTFDTERRALESGVAYAALWVEGAASELRSIGGEFVISRSVGRGISARFTFTSSAAEVASPVHATGYMDAVFAR